MIHQTPSALTVEKKVDLVLMWTVYREHIVGQRVEESMKNKYLQDAISYASLQLPSSLCL